LLAILPAKVESFANMLIRIFAAAKIIFALAVFGVLLDISTKLGAISRELKYVRAYAADTNRTLEKGTIRSEVQNVVEVTVRR
jgi:hypothetical protein